MTRRTTFKIKIYVSHLSFYGAIVTFVFYYVTHKVSSVLICSPRATPPRKIFYISTLGFIIVFDRKF
jgi:hypothetical protein